MEEKKYILDDDLEHNLYLGQLTITESSKRYSIIQSSHLLWGDDEHDKTCEQYEAIAALHLLGSKFLDQK